MKSLADLLRADLPIESEHISKWTYEVVTTKASWRCYSSNDLDEQIVSLCDQFITRDAYHEYGPTKWHAKSPNMKFHWENVIGFLYENGCIITIGNELQLWIDNTTAIKGEYPRTNYVINGVSF